MNKLPTAKRVQILQMLCEGMSMRAISRVADVSINTVSKLLIDAGNACAAFHDEKVRNVKSARVQCDEIWSFCYSKAANVPEAKRGTLDAGDQNVGNAQLDILGTRVWAVVFTVSIQ